MSLTPGARKFRLDQIIAALKVISGGDWDPLAHRLAERMAGVKLRLRGQGVTGNPIGYTLDSYSADGSVAAEFSAERTYFKTLQKPRRDFTHVRKQMPHATSIYLLSTQECPPKVATKVIFWEVRVASRNGINLHVLDARTIGEFILDEILPNESAAEAVAPYFEPLRVWREEEVATHLVPAPRAVTVPRPSVEREINDQLEKHRVALLSGMSGLGKSETAIAVANWRRTQHDWVIWVTGQTIASVADLRGVDVSRQGLRLNLLGMLSTRSCFLVLDNLTATLPLELLLEGLKSACGSTARVLITSQVGAANPSAVEMPLMNKEEAKTLLEQGVSPQCPEDVFQEIWTAAGGHPMTLAMINGSVRTGATWAEIASDIKQVGKWPAVESRKRIVDLLLERWRPLVGEALAFFVWAGTSRVHKGLAKRAITTGATRALHTLGLVAGDQVDTLRLHDIVWSSLSAFEPPISIPQTSFGASLDAYVRYLSEDDARTLALNHLARVHQPLLARLVFSSQRQDGHLYAWLHHTGLEIENLGKLPDPLGLAEGLAAGHPDDFAVLTVVELAEAVLRIRVREGDRDDATLLRPFDVLIGAANIRPESKYHARHHRAKALKRLRSDAQAVVACEELLSDAGALPATRLLLARILTELPKTLTVPNAGPRARDLLVGLLSDAKADPDRASISVTLAAAELLRRRIMAVDFPDVFSNYGQLLAYLIVAAARRGLEQSTLTFAALGARWRRTDADTFWQVFNAIPIPAVDEIVEEDELQAWGEILKAAADTPGSSRTYLLEEALQYLLKCRKRYGLGHAADVLVKLGRPASAVHLLEDVMLSDDKAVLDMWFLQWLSVAYAANGQADAALERSSQAIALLDPLDPFTPYFLEHNVLQLKVAGNKPLANQVSTRLHSWLATNHREAEWSEIEARIALD
jgi:hypothetical protein